MGNNLLIQTNKKRLRQPPYWNIENLLQKPQFLTDLRNILSVNAEFLVQFENCINISNFQNLRWCPLFQKSKINCWYRKNLTIITKLLQQMQKSQVENPRWRPRHIEKMKSVLQLQYLTDHHEVSYVLDCSPYSKIHRKPANFIINNLSVFKCVVWTYSDTCKTAKIILVAKSYLPVFSGQISL